MENYGMEVQLENEKEHRTRFRGLNTFIDVWFSKRGITVGVYNQESKSSEYYRRLSLNKLEDILVTLEKNYDYA